MAIFLSASDETSGQDGTGTIMYGGYLAPESDWWDYFAPAWEERVLKGPPRIPYLHMTDIRSPKWRTAHGLTRAQAEDRVDAAVSVIEQMGSLFPLTSSLNGTAFRRRVRAVAPKGRVGKGHYGMRDPDYLCFLGYAYFALDVVKTSFSDTERVDFVVENNDKVTDRIREFHGTLVQTLTALGRSDLAQLVGALIPGDKERVPLQAADVFCWHVQRHKTRTLTGRDDLRRLWSLTSRSGYEHTWTDDELSRFADAVLRRVTTPITP